MVKPKTIAELIEAMQKQAWVEVSGVVGKIHCLRSQDWGSWWVVDMNVGTYQGPNQPNAVYPMIQGVSWEEASGATPALDEPRPAGSQAGPNSPTMTLDTWYTIHAAREVMLRVREWAMRAFSDAYAATDDLNAILLDALTGKPEDIREARIAELRARIDRLHREQAAENAAKEEVS